MRKLLTVVVATGLSFGAMAAEWSYTASGDIQIPEITEDSTITISSGKTVTNTTALVGTGLLTVKGGGTLYLTQPSPDFSGGVYIGKATVAVTASDALGKGAVTIQGKASAGGTSRIMFDNGSSAIELANDITIESTGGSAANAQLYFVKNSAVITVSGDIRADGTDLYIQDGFSGNLTQKYVTFTGSVTAGSYIYMYGAALSEFSGAVTSKYFYTYSNVGTGATAAKSLLSSSDNCIAGLNQRKNGYARFGGRNAAGGARLLCGMQGYYLDGHDQVAAWVVNDSDNKSTSFVDGGSSEAATLTLTGGVSSAVFCGVLKNKLNLVIDDKGAAGDFVQSVSNAAETMSGFIDVRRGTLDVRPTTVFKNLTGLSIGAAGTLRLAPGLAMPFPNNQTVDVSFETGAAYEGDDIEIMAKSLTIDGQGMEKGVWTHEDNEAIPEGITVTMVSKKIEITESGEIDFAATYGAVDGYWQVTVASGVTVTNTTALAGTSGNVISVSGGGTFVQKVSSPDFASEFRIGKAIVTVVENRGLGTGRIRISGYSKAGGTSQLAFANGSASIEMPNEIVVLGNGESGIQARAQIYFGANRGLVTFSGDVDASGCVFSLFASTALAWTTVGADFTGSVTARQVTLDCRVYKFHGRVDADELYATGNANQGATRYTSGVYLYSSENRIGYCHARKSSVVYAEAVNVFDGSRLEMDIGDCTIGTNSQTVARLGGSASRASISAGTGASVFSTLTLTGGVARATTSMKLANRMNLVVDDCGEAGDFVQVVTNYDGGATAHTMSGTIAVKRGTLRVEDKVTFANVTGVDVSAEGALALGSAAVFGTAANVKKNGLTLRIAPEATVTVDDGLTVNVHRCWIGEEGLRAGDYTGEGGPSTATVLPQLSGTGILHVGRSSGQGLILMVR